MTPRGLVALLLVAALAVCAARAQEAAAPLRLASGETALELNRHILEDLGIEPIIGQVVGEAGGFIRAIFPAAANPSLLLRAPGGAFEGLDGGVLRHRDGFDIVWQGGRVSLRGFELAPVAAPASRTALFELRTADGFAAFFLDHPHAQYLAQLSQLVFLNMDLRLTEEFARRLGRPQFTGVAIGSADVRVGLAGPPAPADRGACVPDLTGDVDVELTGISGLTEVHHDDDRVAMAPGVDLRNLGPADVEWYRPIFPDGGADPDIVGPHPFLVVSLYRLADGVLHQIGRADAKHAFFAANSGCACAGAQILFDGCSDFYAAVTNYNRMNLGPRPEVTASTGSWQSQGSHFDGDPVDDERDHFGEGSDHSDPFEHRLTAASDDLLTPGAQYFIEAWYVTPGDIDIFNSMGRREVVPGFNGSWSFPFNDISVTLGATLDAWIDPVAPPAGAVATVLDTGEGHLELAAATAALPSGAYRYDYGLMNFDFDRRIRSFSVPLPAGVALASIGFRDGDLDPGNDWQGTVTATEITWSIPAGNPALGALDWGTLYSFRFDANAAPTDPTATMDVLEVGSPNQLTAASKGPGGSLLAVSRLEVVPTGSGAGEVTSTPAGIGCRPDCDELYIPDTSVELAAAADPGSALIRWTEGGATLGTEETQDTVLDTNRSLVAVFELCDRLLPAQTVTGAETFEACDVLRAGAGFAVGATGIATLRAGSAIVLDDGFAMAFAGELATEIDPSLLP
ncbi:MAG: hypothetical protein ACE5EG_07455 [Thermoanaerobaculia bacterium]